MIETILWDALMFVCAVGPLIILHELGHYGAGRTFGVRAEAFSIGFGRSIAGWHDKRGTHWKIGWLPLGGYVKFAGEHELDGTPSAHQPPDSFEAKSLWQRAIIIAAGPVANFVVAFVIFCALIAAIGQPILGTRVGVVEPASVAQAAGFSVGDRILSINGQPMADFGAIRAAISAHPSEKLSVIVQRGGTNVTLTATPILHENMDEYHIKSVGGHLGIGPMEELLHPAWYAVPGAALKMVGDTIGMIATVIGKVLTGKIAGSTLGGPLQTAKISGDVAHFGGIAFLSLIAAISINLGFINLLPIPVLDGGHLALYGVEALRRKPLTPTTREWVFRTGLLMIMALFIYVNTNDLASFGVWKRLADLIG